MLFTHPKGIELPFQTSLGCKIPRMCYNQYPKRPSPLEPVFRPVLRDREQHAPDRRLVVPGRIFQPKRMLISTLQEGSESRLRPYLLAVGLDSYL
jgi:hypothetical protein